MPRWRRWPLLGVLGLAGQVAYDYRDLAAARFPQARPALEQACALLGCRVEAARAIDALAVESSGLVRVERSSVYKLSVALRNRAGIEVALPALDLALTDTQGRLIARKVLLAGRPGRAAAPRSAPAANWRCRPRCRPRCRTPSRWPATPSNSSTPDGGPAAAPSTELPCRH